MRGGYGGGNPFSSRFGGGIGGMFPGMGGGFGQQPGFGQRPPMYGGRGFGQQPGYGGGFRQQPPSYGGFGGGRYNRPMPETMQRIETKGPGNLMSKFGGQAPMLQQ
jgi:hypothetical protein